jgi:hypothetical protein
MSSSQWGVKMADEQKSNPDADQQTVYQIRIEGHLGRQRMDWFEGLTITLEEDGNTLLTGPVIDQSALHGILKKIRDLGMPLLLVNSVETATQDASDNKQVTHE